MRRTDALTLMENKAKQIRKIQLICNTILSNCCYHTKQMEEQIARAEKRGNITDEERELICNAWDMRSVLAKELMTDLDSYIKKGGLTNEKGENRTKDA